MCQPEEFDPSRFGPATSHDDPFCLKCLQVAKEQYAVEAPERFAHGEEQADESTITQLMPENNAAAPASRKNTNVSAIQAEAVQDQTPHAAEQEELSQGKRPARALRISSK